MNTNNQINNSSNTQTNFNPVDNDEISLKELIIKLQEWWIYLLGQWKLIVLVAFIGSLLGLGYAFTQKPIYKAEFSFVLEDEKSGGGLGGALGLASQFGFDLGGGGGGGIFAGDNLLELMKSRSMVQKALLSPISLNGKSQSLADYYISFRGLRKAWESKPQLSNLSYGINTTNLVHVSNRMLVKNLKTEGVNLNLPSNAIYKNFVNASYTNSVGQFYRVDSLLQLGISTGNISTISQAKLLNASISTPNLLEQNEKWLNATYIDMQTTEPDSTILLMLEQLAIKCPQYDGEAVYQARSLLMYYFGKSYNSICDMQNIQPSGSRTVNTATVQTEPTYVSASVYPNPTHKDITVTYTKGEGNEAAVFELYNMVGELVVNQTLTENKTTLSLSDLSNGIYIYIIKQDGVTLQTNKLVLSK